MIPEELKSRIKNAVNIVDVINEKVTLNRSGKNFVGICPFHEDKSPSLFVSPTKQSYKCFACGAGGDVFEFISKHELVSFPEAVKWCADRAHIEFQLVDLTPEEVQKNKERESLFIAINAASDFFQTNLLQAKDYLSSRGYDVSDDVLTEFKVGYATEGNTLLRDLTKAGYGVDKLIKVDVVKEGEHGNYDTFRDRLMFPFLNLNGQVIGFSGRMIQQKENAGKYVNTAETELFHKGNAVFGLFQARSEISRRDNVFLVEGQFDVITFHREGIKNTVAGSGTALTPEQIKMLARFTRNVTMIYDGDVAGVKASLRNCKELLKAGMNVRCIKLPEGKDPDNMANDLKDKTEGWLQKATTDFVTYFSTLLNVHKEDPIATKAAYTTVLELIAEISDESTRNHYSKILSTLFGESDDLAIARKKIRDFRRKLPKPIETITPGIYGLEQIPHTLPEFGTVKITSDFNEFLADYSEHPTVYLHGRIGLAQIQELRKLATAYQTTEKNISLEKSIESDYLQSLTDCYKNGMTEIRVIKAEDFDEDNDSYEPEKEYTFLNYYLLLYKKPIAENLIDRAIYIERCVELVSYASESERIVNSKQFASLLGLTIKQYNDILKPFLDKRKARLAINSQREDSSSEMYDPDIIPDYVEESEEYSNMYKNYGYYPLINRSGEPVAYMFKNPKGGHTLVGDFYMTPLLHIYDDDAEQNRRIFLINRRYYKNPFYMEFKSKSLLKRSTMEEVIILREAMNFDNGTDDHWIKIKSCNSRKFITCSEIKIYGQQTEDFYAFSNAIFHENENGVQEVLQVNELGVARHNEKDYYLPAFSKIYAEARKDSDKYEALRFFKYMEIPPEKQCSFQRWADLMDKVYAINNNGKWALIYAIMCAFRSDIHALDRFFTALFFMGPTQSGKTQIAVSIRSLYILPEMGLFNLNTGSDAAFSTLMGSFRDVPVVLDEYNNKDISDMKFQALKSITYDGDARQKRKGTSGKEIESDKIYTPVVLLGQETPQRDDNALMNRIIVCEVPKKGLFTEEETNVFHELKEYEKRGLSNVLIEVLKLRPLIKKHFPVLKREISNVLAPQIVGQNFKNKLV